ncbi:MAG TPA: tetratricopeptide repeat protein [Candidatus Brocadiaceae bacterium]
MQKFCIEIGNMTTHRFFLMIGILSLSCFAISFSGIAQGNLPTIVKKIQPSVVAVVTYDKKGEVLGQASGFFIGKDGNVITNIHVFDGCTSAQVKTADGNVYNITKTLAEDKEGNLIRVSANIPPKAVHPLTLSASLPKVGEKVIVVGSSGLERPVSDGIISGIREIPTFGKIMKITAPLSPGYSGSPVINMKGEIIGLVTFQITEGHDLNFTIHSKRITKLIPDKNKTFAEWVEGRTGEWFSSSEGLYSKGLSFLFSGDYENALSYFEEAVRKNSNQTAASFQIGYCKANLGRYAEAIEAYKQAIRIKPDNADAYHSMGVAYTNLGRYTEAIETFKQEIHIEPNCAEAYYNLGVLYSGLGRYAEAIKTFKEAIRNKPDFAKAHYILGVTYGKLGRYTEAIEAFNLAIRFNPDLTEAYCKLGTAYDGLGRYTKAIETFKLAIRIDPNCAEAHYILGVTYFSIFADKGSALEEYKFLKNLDMGLANKLFNLIYKSDKKK